MDANEALKRRWTLKNVLGREGDDVRKNKGGMVTGQRRSRHKIFIFTVQVNDTVARIINFPELSVAERHVTLHEMKYVHETIRTRVYKKNK